MLACQYLLLIFREGHGTLHRKCNKIYVGDWKEDKRNGMGINYFKDGEYYGQWEGGKRSGLGFMWYKNGAMYMGQWRNNLFEGAGVLVQENGNRFEGGWRNGLKSGEGTFFHMKTGQIQTGIWHEGVCKMSQMEDAFRNQVTNPTIYPLPQLKVENFDQLFDVWKDNFSKLTPLDLS
jgi:hypothetical protein